MFNIDGSQCHVGTEVKLISAKMVMLNVIGCRLYSNSSSFILERSTVKIGFMKFFLT